MYVIYYKVNQYTTPQFYEYHLMVILNGILYETIVSRKNFCSKVVDMCYLRDLIIDMPFGVDIDTCTNMHVNWASNVLEIIVEIIYQKANGKKKGLERHGAGEGLERHGSDEGLERHGADEDNSSYFSKRFYREKFMLELRATEKSGMRMIENDRWAVEQLLGKYRPDKAQFYCPQVLERLVEKSHTFCPQFYFSFSTHTIDDFLTYDIRLFNVDANGKRVYEMAFIEYLFGHPKFSRYRDYFIECRFSRRVMVPNLFQDDLVYQRNIDLLNMDVIVFSGLNEYKPVHPKVLKLFVYDLEHMVLYKEEKKLQTEILLALYEINLEYEFLGKVIVPATMFYRWSVRVVEHPNAKFSHKFKTLKYAEKAGYEACSDYEKRILYNPIFGYYKFKM
jgi:hypothetical protein